MVFKYKLLYILYYFPPLGGAGVIRPLNFVKFLPEMGIEVDVLTIKEIHYHSYDQSLLNQIPKSVDIKRVETPEPLRLVRVIKDLVNLFRGENYRPPDRISYGRAPIYKLLRSLIPPDEKIFSVPSLVFGALKMLSEKKYDWIMTSSPPDSFHLAGLALKHLTGIPWVADFRDPWHTHHLRRDLNIVSYSIDALMERQVVGNSDLIVTTTRSLADEFVQRYNFLEEKKVVTITNGYDPDEVHYRPKMHENKWFVFLSCGNFTGRRTALPFLKAVKLLRNSNLELANRFRFRFIGAFKEEEEVWVRNEGLTDVIEIEGYKEHKEMLKEMLEADVLLLVLNEEFEPTRIPTRVYEYLWAGKPILAIVPPGDTQRIIRKHNAGLCINSYDPEQIMNSIVDVWNMVRGGFVVNREGIGIYSRRELTKKLVKYLKQLI